jgi:hypothetical protein
VSSALRRAVERRSAVPLTWLSTRPRWAPFLLVLALLLGGLFAPPAIAAVLLLVLALLVAWLTYLAWPKLEPTGRLSRLLVLALVAYVLVTRLVG